MQLQKMTVLVKFVCEESSYTVSTGTAISTQQKASEVIPSENTSTPTSKTSPTFPQFGTLMRTFKPKESNVLNVMCTPTSKKTQSANTETTHVVAMYSEKSKQVKPKQSSES